MSMFTALNVEPEVDLVEEIDDSKEIQVEEALKLYQAALKLHVQGPDFYEEAEEAYDALFASEIFKYPESQSEAKRLAQLNDVDDSDVEDADDPIGPPAPAGIEAAPNTLPQLLYLSYKNHGQFLIDRVAHHIAIERQHNPNFVFEHHRDAREATREPLDFFVEALDRDESDANLWRRTARICRLLGSRRLLRFCTEAALLAEGSDGAFESEGSNIESIFAQAELGSVVEELEDDLSKSALKHMLQQTRRISKARKKIMDPFPKLPEPTVDPDPPNRTSSKPQVINISERSWTAIGKALLARRKQDALAGGSLPFANECQITIPGKQESTASDIALTSPQKLVAADVCEKSHSDKLKDHSTTTKDSNVNPKLEPQEDGPVPASIGLAAATARTSTSIGSEATISPTDEKIEGTVSKSRRESEVRSGLKRSSESAGITESGETRSRSKRLRARQETTVAIEEDIDPEEQKKQFEKQLGPFIQADKWAFQVVDTLCGKINISCMGPIESFQDVFLTKSKLKRPDPNDHLKSVLLDFRDSLGTWDLNKSNLLLHGQGSGASVTMIGAADDSGLASFLEHSKPNAKLEAHQNLLSDQGIDDFVSQINHQWHDASQTAIQWIEHLLKPISMRRIKDEHQRTSRYIAYVWPIALKETICHLIVEEDGTLFPALRGLVFELEAELIKGRQDDGTHEDHMSVIELVQALFELHLDIYGKIINASSKVDQPTRILQRDRTKRWAGLASHAATGKLSIEDNLASQRALAYRYLWSTVMYVSLVDPTSREHVLVCLRDLKRTLQDAGEAPIVLPNNAVMPEISVDAVEREITRLTTMDFFLSIFDPNTEDPVATIENLEPILMEAASIQQPANETRNILADAINGDGSEALVIHDDQQDDMPESPQVPRGHKLAEFLSKASASLRLSLWHRLRTAYEEIEYSPLVLLCNIKSLEIIIAELKGSRYSKEAKEDRSANLLVWLRNISDILTSCLDIVRREKVCLDCLDEKHLPTALTVVVDITKILHTFAVWEDTVKVGQYTAPSQPSGAANAYKSAMAHLRELHCKCWTFLYHLLKEISVQYTDLFPDPKGSIAEYLAAVHNAFSWREYCRIGKKAFLKLMRTELINLNPPGDWSLDLAQVVYDLYGLKIYSKSTAVLEHGCNPDQIDRGSALELIEPFMAQANAMNIRDVLRSEMRTAAEKLQAVIGTPRSGSGTSNSSHQAFNRRLLLAYLKASVHPIDLFRSLKGIGALEVMPVVTDYGAIARKKWFFLQGHLLLAKYQAQKRNAPGDDEDLDSAINYFKLDLDFDAESWETWYRLAQTYDAKVDEAITWESKEINDPKSDLVSFQKSAIHCYSMAVAVAVRSGDCTPATLGKISELYADFGIRIYASSRAPLSMKVFDLAEYKRFYNSETRGTYKEEPFNGMKESTAWRLASVLFRKALHLRSESWINWYMLGKCLWKMFNCSEVVISDMNEVLNAFVQAVKNAPLKRDSKHPDKDPVLEPHYKLVSITYKLMKLDCLKFDTAVELLQNSPHLRKIDRAECEDPKMYTLQALKVLRAVDKTNWHHRMVARVAHIYYDDDPSSKENAELARRELTQQIFTKTMTIQVWRPEYERPGRHFVYKTEYTRFFVRLLGQLDDRASVDLLAKRIRKKQNDFIAHADLWLEVVTVYLKLLRNHGQIAVNHTDAVFKSNISFENFILNAGRLEAWAHSQLSLGNPTLDLLREIVELKKLNGVYIKPGPIDELVEDTYARIYEENVPTLAAKAGEAENRERMRIDRMLMNDDEPEQETTASAEAPTTSGRPKTIGRGEIRRRAEALVSRLVAPTQARRGGKREPQSPTVQPRGGLHPGDNNEEGRGESVAPSMLDDVDADDESELSEPPPDEDEEDDGGNNEHKPTLIFPGLAAKEQLANEDMADAAEDDEGAAEDTRIVVPKVVLGDAKESAGEGRSEEKNNRKKDGGVEDGVSAGKAA